MLTAMSKFLTKGGKYVTKGGKFVVIGKDKDPSDCDCCDKCPSVSCEWVWELATGAWRLTRPDGENFRTECQKAGCDCKEPDFVPDLLPGEFFTIAYTPCGNPGGQCEDVFRDCKCEDITGYTTAEDEVRPDGTIYRSCCPPFTRYIGNDLCECLDPGDCPYANNPTTSAFFNELVACYRGKCVPAVTVPAKTTRNPLP